MAYPVLDAARRVGPSLAARSIEIEQAGTLPPDVVADVVPTGAFRMWTPADLGGPQASAWEGLAVIEELAFHDGATGWCAMIGSTSSLLASFLADEHAKAVFGAPDDVAGGWAAPAGRATVVDGGLRVSGRWQWGSGGRHCTWIGGGCLLVDDDGKPSPRADGLLSPFVFFPADDVTFVDNWDVSGLAGTGSSDYEVVDAFVPEGRWVQVGADKPVRQLALSRFSFYGLLACGVAAAAVGIGRRSIDELCLLAKAKKPQGSSRTLAERGQIQGEVAMAEAKLSAAWALLEAGVADAWETATGGGEPNDDQKRTLRLAASHATQTAAEVAEAMYKAGGGAAVYRTSPLQRCFRDVYVATQHQMVAPRTFDTWGRLRLGLDTDTRFL
jgi:alkylation response protein AidB-like acyl-CoA dehydrogenase